MNIYHFASEIDAKILTRGHDYYLEGTVLEVSREGDREYFFEVEGSEVYEVAVRLDEEGEILHSGCDCPYDLGPVCKHEVAAYYELLDILNDGNDGETVQAQTFRRPDLPEILNALSKAQLIEIIAEIAAQDAVLKNNLIFKYSQGNNAEELEQCRKLIASIVRKHQGRGGYIE